MASSSDRDQDPKDRKPQPDNPFIKFRQFADAQIGSLLQGIIGLPSAFSKTPSGNARWADFDDELRRRDELQARQKELRESEARRNHDNAAGTPAKQSSGWLMSSTTEEPLIGYQPRNENVGKEIPLYSPVTKALFGRLSQADKGADWNHHVPLWRFDSWRDDFRREYYPFKLKQNQNPSSDMEAIRYMAYNELDESSLYRSDYSLLPYLLFSPYSPIKLQLEARNDRNTAATMKLPQPQEDTFPYDAAFEDLIEETTQGSISSPFPPSLMAIAHFGHLSSSIYSHHTSIYPHHTTGWMQWTHDLHWKNLLQQREVKQIPRLTDMIPDSAFSRPKANSESEEDSEAATTEQDMYDRFLRWASTPSALTGALDALDSLCTDTEEFFKKLEKQERALQERASQERALQSPEGKKGVVASLESGVANPNFNKDTRETLETLEKSVNEGQCQRPNRILRELWIRDTPAKLPQDPDKVVSTSTTTSHTTHEDGAVETCVTVWKRYADGRESVTETNHYEDPSDEENHPRQPINPELAVKKMEEKKVEKKGWFWN